MRAVAPVLLALLFPGILSAQTVRGRVFEYGTSYPIEGATIELVGSRGERVATTSDSSGYFILFPGTSGTVTVEVTHPSYVAEGAQTVAVRSRETVTLIVRMTRQAIPIEPIVVTARSASALGGFHERQRWNPFGQYLDEKEIERRRPVTFDHLLRGLHRIEIETEMGSSRVTLPSARPPALGQNFGRCDAAVFVDGMPVSTSDTDLESLLPLTQVAAVEVYTDPTGVPFEFTTIGNDCGVVAFWSRPVRDPRPVTMKRVGLAALLIGAVVIIQQILFNAGDSDIFDPDGSDLTFAPTPLEAPPLAATGRPAGG